MAAGPACMAAFSVLGVTFTEEMPLPKEKGRPSLEVVPSALTGVRAGLWSPPHTPLPPPACLVVSVRLRTAVSR